MSTGRDSESYLAPRSASPEYVVEKVLGVAQITSQDVIYDLGCNDGRVLVAAARLYGAKGVGIEWDDIAVKTSLRNVDEANVASLVTIVQGDVFDADLSQATVVYLYLSSRTGLERLSRKLRQEVRKDARVLSFLFRVPDWEPYLQSVQGVTSGKPGKVDVSDVSKLYLYKAPGIDADQPQS